MFNTNAVKVIQAGPFVAGFPEKNLLSSLVLSQNNLIRINFYSITITVTKIVDSPAWL